MAHKLANGLWPLIYLAGATAMTACHWFMVDVQPEPARWQRDLYVKVLNHQADPPHQYRPLPYELVHLLEWCTQDWHFSCLAYRWFFNYWLLGSWHHFACLFHTSGRAALTLLPLLAYYPLSIARYYGQLTDPLSHTLFILGFIFIIQGRPLALAFVLALGVFAKETAVLLIPCWFVCRGWKSWPSTALLILVAAMAFLAARVPFGWLPGSKQMNGAGLMIGTNLGIGQPVAYTPVSLAENYLHPLLFIVPFVPFIIWQWRAIDLRLRLLAVTLTPLLLASNLCFGWLYESRNYVPLLPVLATMALPMRNRGSSGLAKASP